MIGHILSLMTLGLIFKHLQSKGESFSEKNKTIRMLLMILSISFSMLYFIWGILSILKGISVISLFKMEYGLIFVYATYKLFVLNKAMAYYTLSNHSEAHVNTEAVVNTLEKLIKDTMICLEDEEFEKAFLIVDKVDPIYAVDHNVELLRTIVNQSLKKSEGDFSKSLCY